MAQPPQDNDVTLEGLRFYSSTNVFGQRDEVPPPIATARTAAAGPIIVGTRIADRYEIEEALGRGGMGQVFRVRHVGLGRKFALKLLHTDLSSDEDSRALFYREARVASTLAHPNIVSVVDFGEDAALGAFMVMELVEGDKLSTHLRKEGRLAQKPWCDMMLQLAEAVHHIHQHDIVHGDIKPENLILCLVPSTDRRKSFIKLLDFGLARAAAANEPRADTVAGTPHYLAPERLRGESSRPAMDIYAVGIVGYELLTGMPPFDGSLAEVLDAHLHTAPPTFASRGVTGVDERAEALVMRALAKKPQDRQKDMAAFLYELRTLMAMLGMGRRRAVTTPRPQKRDEQSASKAALFDAVPIPLAGVDSDGRIVVANHAFSKFVGADADLDITGLVVAATRLIEVFPTVMAEVRHVHISGHGSKNVIRLQGPGDEPVDLLVWMVPGAEPYGDVTLTIHSLPQHTK